MRAEEQAYLDSLPEGPSKESWRKAYAAVRFRPPADVPLKDLRVWQPPVGAPMMPDPRTYPYHHEPLAHPYPILVPRPLTWNEYWQLFSQALVTDPVTEATDPYRIRLELSTWTPPYDPHPGGVISGGFCYAWRTVATWVEHLRAGDRITVSAWQGRVPWRPGTYDFRGDIGQVYWMSRYA
jgi:hypothetical protein